MVLRCACVNSSQAGLFSAVTSAFIIEGNSQLRPDPNDETAALLRVLIHKIDNTTFGDNPPTLPQWTGPPRTIVQVQASLFASLAASLFSAFLATLGKQWLNRYAATNMRGSAIERSQNRQRKLDGIVTWYFDHVMESLPLMLQFALLLLGCALSRYLWEINTTVASVVLGATSFGVAFYIFIIVAGVISESCPYQTPGFHALRYPRPKVLRLFHSTFRNAFRGSKAVETIAMKVAHYRPWWSRGNIAPFLKDVVLKIPHAIAIDVCRLGRAMIKTLATFPAGAYRLGSTAARSLVSVARRVHHRLQGTSSAPEQRSDQQITVLDLRCISWMVQTSLDKAVHLSTLKHLATMATLSNLDPALVADCFSIFIGCIKVDNCKVVIMQGLEQLAAVSATCFLRTFRHLSVMDPTSNVLDDVRQRYNRVFPLGTDFRSLPFYHTAVKIHTLANKHWSPRHIQWGDYRPCNREHVPVARGLVDAAQEEYQHPQRGKVPRWILRFALHSLSLGPFPPTSVVADCLSIVAIDLGCNVSNTGDTILDERYVHISQMTITLTLNQCTSGANFDSDNSESRNESQIWRSPFAPIEAQGDHCAPPLRSLAGARWETRDAGRVLTCCQSIEGEEVHVASRWTIF